MNVTEDGMGAFRNITQIFVAATIAVAVPSMSAFSQERWDMPVSIRPDCM
ncbi:MAG: hypothetical protein OXN84_04635 [Albidovulum sp.]|nr:hypothetical protein [Albidovulum sp.]